MSQPGQPTQSPALPASFTNLYSFALDPFQVQAGAALQAGQGVLVAAPTGSGKTVVGEFAVHLACSGSTKCFYTTPIKALSNQKYHDLVARYGSAQVGLLTGDNSVNPDAAVVVMTTEVLRNMLYAQSQALTGLQYVVMDEVHYLADRERGPVWEEVIINLPEHISVVALSATVSNAEEFGAWLREVRGETAVIVEERRPVPLWQHVLAQGRLHDLFVEGSDRVVNPDLVRIAREDQRAAKAAPGHRHGRGPSHPSSLPRPERGGRRPRSAALVSRPDAVEALRRARLLPAICFIFSRAGCEAAVAQCLHAGLRLTTSEERTEIRQRVQAQVGSLSQSDLAVLGFDDWLDGLLRGVAAHHAGLIPTFKETVEELFQAGLIKVVFATETLALGINMPARAVLLERLVKWNGQSHAQITPGEYTQLTGRAGRRGIDVEGHAVVAWHAGLDPTELAGLASTRTYPLNSSFAPSYNMAVNLVGQIGRAKARKLLESSFAQFQADRGYVGLARAITANDEAIAGYEKAMACHLGDFGEYAAIREQISSTEKRLARTGSANRRERVVEALRELVPGDVIQVRAGRRSQAAVVIDAGPVTDVTPAPLVLGLDRQVRRVGELDFRQPPVVLARLRVPAGFPARSANARRELVNHLRSAVDGMDLRRAPGRRDGGSARDQGHEDQELAALRARMRAHPCHGCADREEHARWAERAWRLRRENAGLVRRRDNRTASIARQFDRICAVLAELGYLSDAGAEPAVTDLGRRLARIYGDCDLLAMQCLRSGIWTDLNPAELAGAAAMMVYQSRASEAGAAPPRLPAALQPIVAQTSRIAEDLAALERRAGLTPHAAPDPGFVWAAHRWAGGASLQSVLAGTELTAGDFVRWCKQVMDFLGQLAAAEAGSAIAERARAASDRMRRGVVAVSSIEDGSGRVVTPPGLEGDPGGSAL